MSVFKSVREYRIDLDKEGATYYPGEEVTGKLVLETSGAIKCRGIRVRLEGIGACHWHHGSGDNRKDFSGSKKYVSKRVTVFGNFYRTQLLDEAGENAYFDAATGGGDMPFAARGDETLAVRVMDYDWGKRDDMLGECTVRLADLLARGGEAVSFPLFRKGGGDRGEVTVSAAPSAAGITVLRCHQATGLKQGDWFGKNDVYVQCYEVDATSNASEAALPEPDKNVELPADRHEYAFSFSIPDVDLPSSADGPMPHGNADSAYVRYSLYSNVDIKMRMDPSTRLPITVVAKPRLPPPAAYAPVQRADSPPQEMYACDCCVACGLGCPQGTAQFQASISHTAPCVGDVVHVSAVATNNTQGNATFHVDLVTLVTLRTRGSRRATFERKPVALGSVDVPAASTAAFGPSRSRACRRPSPAATPTSPSRGPTPSASTSRSRAATTTSSGRSPPRSRPSRSPSSSPRTVATRPSPSSSRTRASERRRRRPRARSSPETSPSPPSSPSSARRPSPTRARTSTTSAPAANGARPRPSRRSTTRPSSTGRRPAPPSSPPPSPPS